MQYTQYMSNIRTIFMLFRAFWMSYVPETSGHCFLKDNAISLLHRNVTRDFTARIGYKMSLYILTSFILFWVHPVTKMHLGICFEHPEIY
jgi:hypothetical protein